jgi:serine/threonine protein kinase
MSTHDQSLLFFMEYAPGGTLLDLVTKKKGLSEGEAQFYFIQMFSAVRHLHMYHFVAHRDLKLENILIGKRGVVKVSDFGLAGSCYNNLMHTFVGTGGFQAPEIVAGNEYTEKCDVWSLGICLYAMVSGKFPFSTQNTNYRLFLTEIANFKCPPQFSPMLSDLIQKMLVVKPDDRPSLMKLQSHPWLKGLDQLGTNIAPHPIVFQIPRSIAAISKFKRRKTVPKADILTKCGQLGIDCEKLTIDLSNGETNGDTTTYFILCQPIAERPVICVEAPKPPPIPDLVPKQDDVVPVARARRTHGSTLTGMTRPAPLTGMTRPATLGSNPQLRATARGGIPIVQRSAGKRPS